MKIEHTKNELTVIERGHEWEDGTDAWCIVNSPHKCSVPDCPGDLNRRKLEMFDGLLEALTRVYLKGCWAAETGDEIGNLIAKAKALK